MDEKPEENKSLIDIDEIFRQKTLKNTSLADLAIKSLEPLLETLPDRSRIFTVGNAVTAGGNFDGSITATGNFSSKGITVTNSITTAGNTTVNDLMIVKKNSRLAGNNTFKGNVVFSGRTAIAGHSSFGENIIASKILSITGTSNVAKQIITDARLVLGGKIYVGQIQSLDKIFVRGKLFSEGKVSAKKFQQSKGGGEIKGDLMAKDIGIGRNRQLKRYLTNFERKKSLTNPIAVIKYVGNIIMGSLFDRKSKDVMEIHGDVIAHEVFLENVVVHGDINAKKIIIGDNVEIEGRVEYSESLNILTKSTYNVVQIGSDEIKYIGTDEDNADLIEEK